MNTISEYIMLALSGFLSATLLPGSSEIVLISMLSDGMGAPMLLVAAATIGNVLGSLFNWLCGKYLLTFMGRWWFPVSAVSYEKAKNWFEHYGQWSLLLSWLPVVGDPLTLLAGTLNVRLRTFVVLVTIGKLARYAFIAGITGAAIG